MNSTHIFAATTVLLAAIICFGFATAPSRSPDQDMESRVLTPAPALAHKQRFGHRITLPTQIPTGNQQVKPCVVPNISAPTDNHQIDTGITPPTPTPIGNQQVEPCAALPLVPSADNPPPADCTTLPDSQEDNGLILHYTFDSEESVTKPAVGLPGKLVNAKFVAGHQGQALYVTPQTSPVFTEIPPAFLSSTGCIEFWAKIDNPPARPLPGQGSPCFFHMQPPNEIWKVSLMWNGNNGAGGGGLCGAVQHYPAFSDSFMSCVSPFDKLLGDKASEWHHYALVWNTEGIASLDKRLGNPIKVAVYLDGRPEALDTNVRNPVWGLSCFQKTSMTLGFPMPPGMCDFNRVAFAIDEFKIWNFDKVEFDIGQ